MEKMIDKINIRWLNKIEYFFIFIHNMSFYDTNDLIANSN